MSELITVPATIFKNGFLDLPLLSHIEGDLYVGCSPCYWPAGHIEKFPYVFNLYIYEEYPKVEGQIRYDLELRDSEDEGDMPFKGNLEEVARMVNAHCGLGPTLVHCQMGINRSNLVAGLALILRGMSPEAAIKLLRDKRSELVLLNKTFEKFLLSYAAPQHG